MRVAVAGGTGTTGRRLVTALTAAGHEPVVLARSAGADLVTGDGLDDLLKGVDAVIDASNVTTTGRKKSRAFFDAAGRNLLAAEERAGVGHHVALSIVGIDKVDFGYYEGKRRQEELVRAGSVPWTVLRATQFHEFTPQTLGQVPGPVAVVPRMLCRPVAVAEVAQALVRLAEAPPAGMAPELAGPRDELLVDQARRYLRAAGRRRLVLPVRLPGAAGSEMAAGGLLPEGAGPRGTQTFDEWLAAEVGPGRDGLGTADGAAARPAPGHGRA
ncbi:Uncharacterized conserved protein YbjT, contains NAD(P)-binding and DUF2867 domains [Actinacidiphila alni]|uniref:Uncharacterized conserved protein YbjT, contains NAD(P)-binding and DUF2867 domains n=1 Tax=Actinacidiphila alni TaxID=380248 RepID=A0A1I2JWX2_9ACTN|nr:NAD(P)H-binding protein [Actinacidiphila alni]SFF57246.1 Uncharacterized conserved protein YbjT, contains NAD(P)-binding and DUF2867 domains [Actinacidiphila alni]